MVWYFNFCSPHLTDDSSINLNRNIMVSQVLIACIITFIIHTLSLFYQKKQQQHNNNQSKNNSDEKDNRQYQLSIQQKAEENSEVDMKSKKKVKVQDSYPNSKSEVQQTSLGFFNQSKQFFLTVEEVQNQTPIYLGHFLIALSMCIMYSPFIYQTLLGITYISLMTIMIICQSRKMKIIVRVIIGLCYLINIILICSGIIGLGLSNWDDYNMSCYYTTLDLIKQYQNLMKQKY